MKAPVKSVLSLAVTGLALLASSHSAQASCTTEPYIGSICYTAASYCPAPIYVEADGSLLQANSNTALFALLGKTYGGDGVKDFRLPDLRQRLVIGSGPTLAQGTARGSDTVTLSINNLPAHSHQIMQTAPTVTTVQVSASGNNATASAPSSAANQLAVVNGPSAKAYAPAGGTQVPLAGVNVKTTSGTILAANTGYSMPADIVPKETTLLACIAVMGVFPSRP